MVVRPFTAGVRFNNIYDRIAGSDNLILGQEGLLEENLILGDNDGGAITGAGQEDLLLGGAGADVINGGEGDDTIVAGGGNDSIIGSEGDDIIDGGSGDNDWLDYSVFDEGVDDAIVLDLSQNTATIDFTGPNDTQTIYGIENVKSGSAADTLVGNSADNVLDAGAGNDSIDGREGDDILLGDIGNDTLIGGEDNDRLIGGTGNDKLIGGIDSDVYVFGGSFGADTITDTGGTLEIEGSSSITIDPEASTISAGGRVLNYAESGSNLVLTDATNSADSIVIVDDNFVNIKSIKMVA